jgi:hypothetical protein
MIEVALWVGFELHRHLSIVAIAHQSATTIYRSIGVRI